MASLRQILNRPLFGTKVIPADARVDPSLFSEEEFPVHCAKCEYLLRGLPGAICPECGTPFDRGRLLVQEYVDLKRKGYFYRRYSRWLWAIVIGYYLVRFGAHRVHALILNRLTTVSNPGAATTAIEHLALLVRFMLVADLLMLVAFLVPIFLMLRQSRRLASKRKRIVSAIEKAQLTPDQPLGFGHAGSGALGRSR